MEQAALQQLGDELYAAMCERRMVAPLTETNSDLSIENAYQISLQFLANRVNAGETVIGKKIGVIARTAKAVLVSLKCFVNFGIIVSHIVLVLISTEPFDILVMLLMVLKVPVG